MFKKIGLVLILAIIAGILWAIIPAEYLTLEGLKAQQQSLTALVNQNLPTSITIFFVIYVAAVGLSLPIAAPMTLAAGALFGLLLGVIIVSFASTIGATIAFLLYRYLFRSSVESKFPAAIASANRGLKREGAFYLFALRLVPIFPFWLVNLLMAVSSFSVFSFFWVSQIGMLPGTIAYVFAGTQLAQIESFGDILSPGIITAFVVLGLLPLLSKWTLERLRTKKLYASYEKPKTTDYNIVVLGAGSGGLVTSYIAAAVQAKVALVEKHKMGGDCLNTGCVPSKALIRSAKAIHEYARAKDFGLQDASVTFNFSEIMDRVHEKIAAIEPHDSVERYTSLGVDCFIEEAKILDPFRVQVGEQILTTQNIVVATGGRPFVPQLPGIDDVTFYTSDTIWELRELPRRLVILGGGPIGSELAQCYSRFGSKVTIIDKNPKILGREDEEASQIVMDQFQKEGIKIQVNSKAIRFEKSEGLQKIFCETPDGEKAFEFDAVLVALGRKANVTGFGLEDLNVTIRENGTIDADDYLRTNYPNIFVAGDVTGPYQFTHFSAHQAWYAAVNGLFQPFKRYRTDYRVIPRCTFTDPEVASVGISKEEADKQGIKTRLVRYALDDLDRAIADSSTDGFVKVLVRDRSDEILGVTIVGVHAGDLMAEFVLAMKYRIGLNKILGTIHAYPTLAEANKFAAGVWKKETKPEWALKYVEKFHAWRRGA